MTTTSTFSGINEEAKPTSRVLRPPGGGSSNIFGVEPSPAPAAARNTSKPTDSGIFGAMPSETAPKSGAQRSARDGDDSYNRLFGDSASSRALSQKSPSASQRGSTHANLFGEAPDSQGDRTSTQARSQNSHDKLFGETAPGDRAQGRYSDRGRGSYNPITGSEYRDLAPNHHALNVKETPKAQKEQPPLPGSDDQYQVREGKMQNVQTSTRVTNPPGGKTHKLW